MIWELQLLIVNQFIIISPVRNTPFQSFCTGEMMILTTKSGGFSHGFSQWIEAVGYMEI